MFRLVLLLCSLALISAKIVNKPDAKDDMSTQISGPMRNSFVDPDEGDKLWVLDLKGEDWRTLKLRPGTTNDEEDFDYFAGPLIEKFKKRQGSLVNKDESKLPKPESLNKKLKTETKKKYVTKDEIFKVINKFALSDNTEPDSYLFESDEEEGPVLALYFKGPFTQLIVKLGNKQRHYFISPPSPFPSWFHEDHTAEVQDNSVFLPEDVKDRFYVVLLRTLQVFLGFPV